MYATTSKERLQQYARHKFGTMKAMEVHCGLVNGQIGSSSGLNVSSLQKILEACPELSPDWVIMGTGTMERQPDNLKPLSAMAPDYEQPIAKPDFVSDPPQPYKGKIKDGIVAIPASLLTALQQQLENKDAQIATLLQLLNSK